MAPKSNFIVRGGLDYSNITKGLNNVQKQFVTFQALTEKSMNLVKRAIGTVAVGKLVKDSVSAAMSVESSIGQISRNLGANASGFNEWAKTQSKAFGMAKEEAYKYGSVYSNLVRGFAKSTDENEKYTTRLLKASSVAASATGRTIDDTMERIRSGILGNTESIEDLGVYANVAMIESTKAFKELANGKTWNQLDYQTQQQIRVMSILEQITNKYGDTLANTTITKQNYFIATLKNIRLNIGQAFLPIYNVVLPALNSLASKIENITGSLAVFSQSLFGKAIVQTTQNTEAQTEAVTDMGNAAEQAGKQAKKAVAGFDELNIISSKSSSGSSASTSTTTPSNPSGTTTIENGNGISQMFSTLSKAVQPTVKALGRLKEALAPVANFVFDNIKNFYNDFLVPVGKWVLGEGLPRLLNVASGLLESVNWKKLSTALSELYKSLAPFAISVGNGLILFIESLSDILKPALSATSDMLATGITAIAKAIGLIPKDVAIAIGGAIGGIATAILLFNGATKIAGIVSKTGTAISTMIGAIAAHPVLAIAAAIGALAGAVLALDKAKFDASNIGQYIQKIDTLVDSSSDLNKEIQTMLDNQKEKKSDIESEYGAIRILADKYFDLADKSKLTNEQQVLLKAYAEELIKKMPELSGKIDAQTGAYKGTKEAIQGVIDKSLQLALVQAAQDSLTETAKGLYDAEMNLKALEEARKDASNKLTTAQNELNTAIQKSSEYGQSSAETAKKVYEAHQKYDETIQELKDSIGDIDTQISTTTQTQKNLNKQWNYATEYISTYSSTASKEMPKVEAAVSDALGRISKDIQNFKLPKLMIEAGVYTKDALGNLNKAYDTRAYATGGFPEDGLFYANHSELVGTFSNGKTAVANNEQITTGIKNAVSEAMLEDAALMREQNDILKSILAKTGFNTKDLFKAVASENDTYINKHNRSRFAY